MIVVRIVWVFPATYLPRWIWRPLRERDPYPPWQVPALISWTGMRGAVSLAAALAVPLETDDGAPLVERNTIIFVTFVVILGTLVLQGLSLPAVIRRLGLEADGLDDREELKARIRGAEAALARIEELADEDWVRDDTAERLRGLYRFRQHRFQARFDDEDDGAVEERSADYQRRPARAAGGRAPGGRQPARQRPHRRRGHAARAARHRPRGGAPRPMRRA